MYILFNKAFLNLEHVGFKTNSITDPTRPRYFFCDLHRLLVCKPALSDMLAVKKSLIQNMSHNFLKYVAFIPSVLDFYGAKK